MISFKAPSSRWILQLAIAVSCFAAVAAPASAQPARPGQTVSQPGKMAAEGNLRRLSLVVEQTLGTSVDSIGPSPVDGLFEVVTNGRIYYIDKSGKYIVDGHVVDVTTRSSVTAKRQIEITQADKVTFDPRELNFADAIKTVQGKMTPGRVLVIFEDPRCGFCKALHRDLAKVKDVVIYTFQVSFLGPESRALNEAVFCSADKAKAWAQVMVDGPRPQAAGKCDLAPLDRNADAARKFRVAGTPTIFFADGQKIVGAVSSAAIEKALLKATSLK